MATRDDAIEAALGGLVECRRFHARIIASRCIEYREKNPERCKGCVQVGTMDAAPAEISRIKVDGVKQEAKRKAEPMADKPKRTCLDCREEKSIIGRGLCGSCYWKHKNAGTLLERFPTLKELEANKELHVQGQCEEPTIKSEEVASPPPTDFSRPSSRNNACEFIDDEFVPLPVAQTTEKSLNKKKPATEVAEVKVRFGAEDDHLLQALKTSMKKNRRASLGAEILCQLERVPEDDEIYRLGEISSTFKMLIKETADLYRKVQGGAQ